MAQESRPAVMPAVPAQTSASTNLRIPLLSTAVHLSDFTAMKPREGVAQQMEHVSGFIQNAPSDGRPATEKTEVWVGHTINAIYVVFACFDHTPKSIRGHLTRREEILSDDTVSVLLDPFQDRRRGVLFSLNAAGVQADAAWTENSNPDYSYDQVWDSEARVTQQGWMALFAIPFRSLRFRPQVSDWGVVFMRNLPRNSEVDDWPHIASTITGVLSQEATLLGIEGGTGSHDVQINPYVLGQSEHTLRSPDPANPYFSTRHLEGTAGGELKAVIKDSIVLDATVNPDFSDVESDQPQFTVNQRYSVYFPELRPFFLENANYFATQIRLVNTRDIIHPEFGARATGKIGRTNIGLFAIDDRFPGETVPREDPRFHNRAVFGVGRVSQDLGKGSSVGATYTDVEFSDSSNRVGGFDFTARLNDSWTWSGQMVESSTRNRDGSYRAGPASYMDVVRNGHSLNFFSNYEDYSSGFQSQVGFIPTSNLRSNHTHATYQWYPKHHRIQSFGIETNQKIAFDHQGNRVYHYSTCDPFLLLPGNVILAPLLGENSDTLGPQNGYGLTRNRNFTENFGGFVVKGAPLRQLTLNITALKGGNVNYNPAGHAQPSLMDQEYLQALITLQPLRQLTLENTYLLDRNHAARSAANVFENQTLRTKINYQFTRALSARVIVEYDSLHVNPLQTSLVRTKQVQTQVLLSWLPHPGTAIYVGYNGDLQNLSHDICSRSMQGVCLANAPILPRSSQYLNDGRQFFVKASYLLRF